MSGSPITLAEPRDTEIHVPLLVRDALHNFQQAVGAATYGDAILAALRGYQEPDQLHRRAAPIVRPLSRPTSRVPDDVAVPFGRTARELRLHLGLSQNALARQLDCWQAEISHLERLRAPPTPALAELAMALAALARAPPEGARR
jgi:hypothetical protein